MSFTILGTGSALPKQTKTNDDLSCIVDTSDEWITLRTGIKQRHILKDESLTDLAIDAAKKALADADTLPQELDLIICSTIRSDYYTPSLSCVIQKEIKADCPAFDVNAACSGFIYALDIAAAYFESKRVKKILVLAAEAMTKLVDWNDRSTCVLFGDGAAATVLGEGNDLMSIKLSAKGDVENMFIHNINGNCPYSDKKDNQQFLTMHGQNVYKFAVSSMTGELTKVIKDADLTKDDITYILPHQANIRIIDAAQNRLKIPKEKCLINIDTCANISSATIPLLMDMKNKEGLFKKGDILALCAFGGGFTTGSCVIRWNK